MKRALRAIVVLAVGAGLLIGILRALVLRPYEVPPFEVGQGPVQIRYTGISGYELTDGETTILLDPVVTRPSLARLASGPIDSDLELAAAVFPRADFILVNHAHYDHVIDAPGIARRTGATIVGTRSTCHLALARGVPASQTIEVQGGEDLVLGSFRVHIGRSVHTPIVGWKNPMAGTIPKDAGPLWFWEYTQDGALSFHLTSGEHRIWFHPTSTYEPGELEGRDADTLIVGVTGEPLTPDTLRAMANEAPSVALVLPTHHDNFFAPRARGMTLFPGLDLRGVAEGAATAWPHARFVPLGFDDALALP